ncbi:RNA-binding protein [Pseudoxanthomonas gei]|uniref:Dual-specificity RNA pseudouridine synthase RluF n=1 Tax=Pseudoxanthomonas gei TaxID=1383030 RepID=A0ABX0AEZ5_9GAMM|nr:rRNA pseudouridine synthase [Pseudoxanthomonas gei]NDK40190.1 RNA-binding protein [Pseudoxanthomonas gei]
MPDPVRLAKRVAEIAGCSRREADQYIQGGWVTVDGEVIDAPQHPITDQVVVIDPEADLDVAEPATLLLHKPAGVAYDAVAKLAMPESHTAGDDPSIRVLKRHFVRLTPLMPMDDEASGLVVLSQDGRVWRRLSEDADLIEQEFVVEVEGELAPYGLPKLCDGMLYQGRALPRAKVSWQNEDNLRFAIKAVRPGQLRHMCAQVGLEVRSIRRIRIGRIPLSKMPVGEWRYLPVGEKF